MLQLGILINKTLNVSPLVIAPKDGPLRQSFIENGMNVIIDSRVQDYQFYSDIACLISIYEHTIIQTVCLPNFIKNYASYSSDCINWVHESYILFKKHIMPYYNNCDLASLNFRIWCGSGLSIQIAHFFKKTPHLFFYGISDYNIQQKCNNYDKITFIHVGEITERKSQLTYINAIKHIPKEIRKKALFYLIGGNQTEPDYAQKVINEAKKVSEIAYYDNMPLQNLMEIYKISHILVSTSTDDPMPTVVSYALMFGMVSIVSNRIGHAQIFNEENGIFTVYNNNEQKYAELMTFFINNAVTLPLYRQKARDTYCKYFSMDVFKKHFFELLYEKQGYDTSPSLKGL